MRLKDRVAIITGAASGIGRATALLFAEEGAKIVAADVDDEGSNETVNQIQAAGNEAFLVRTDVTSTEDVQAMVKATIDTYGKLDILFNSAGIAMRLPVAELPEADWDRCIEVNLKGVYLCFQVCHPQNNQERWWFNNQHGVNLRHRWRKDPGRLCCLQRCGRQPDARNGTGLC